MSNKTVDQESGGRPHALPAPGPPAPVSSQPHIAQPQRPGSTPVRLANLIDLVIHLRSVSGKPIKRGRVFVFREDKIGTEINVETSSTGDVTCRVSPGWHIISVEKAGFGPPRSAVPDPVL